jgi:hypothetical protein
MRLFPFLPLHNLFTLAFDLVAVYMKDLNRKYNHFTHLVCG